MTSLPVAPAVSLHGTIILHAGCLPAGEMCLQGEPCDSGLFFLLLSVTLMHACALYSTRKIIKLTWV